MTDRPFTGRHALLIFGGAFAVIITVNLILAFSAVRTFPGLETKNSYVASQKFNGKRDAQQALGWTVEATAQAGEVRLEITDAAGAPVKVASLQAIVGRATHVRDDVAPEFMFDGSAYVTPLDLERGNWNIRMRAWADDGTEFSQRVVLHVEP